jgi:hypothetical protein
VYWRRELSVVPACSALSAAQAGTTSHSLVTELELTEVRILNVSGTFSLNYISAAIVQRNCSP